MIYIGEKEEKKAGHVLEDSWDCFGEGADWIRRKEKRVAIAG